MKRLLVVLVLIFSFFTSNISLANDLYKELDFTKSNKAAEKILYNYVLKDFEWTEKEAKDLARITPDAVSAIWLDLNGDSIPEIIGAVWSSACFGTAVGFHLYVLQKLDGKYEDISMVGFHSYPEFNVKILKHRTRGYYDIQVYESEIAPKRNVATFRNGLYYQLDYLKK